jgi:ATP-dependent RNA helicase DDX35
LIAQTTGAPGTMADTESFIPALHKPSPLLPIARHKDALLYTIETYPVTVLIGQTGSGKTTQLPQFLEQAGWRNDGKVIAVTQASPPNIRWFRPIDG